jgi:HTH-type transcriptional regulator/antitoxin HipB
MIDFYLSRLYHSRTGMKNATPMTTQAIGTLVKQQRKQLGLNQAELAMTSGTGVRFISDLENGKETCQLGKSIKVLETLGLQLSITSLTAK